MYSSGKTFYISTLGCKLNQYEAQLMRENLIDCGFIESVKPEQADIYIINSCTVTAKSDSKTRVLARRLKKMNQRAKIVICGCLAELEDDRGVLLNTSGITHLIRNEEKPFIGKVLLENPELRLRLDCNSIKRMASKKFITDFKDRSRAFVKIQDGCNNRCTYCKIPFVRGVSRSRPVDDILTEIYLLIKKGFKEIVLTGVCIGSWGIEWGKNHNLSYLLRAICSIKNLPRIRLSSIEPMYITEDLIRIIKDNKNICRHLHIPLQSGDNDILKLMNRPYDTYSFRKMIKMVRAFMPEIGFTTDIIVGFPGEEKKNFLNTLSVVKSLMPSRIHVFSYSPRPQTASYHFRKTVPSPVIKQRVKILIKIGKMLQFKFAKKQKSKIHMVLIEEERDKRTGLLAGYTENYIRVLLEGGDELRNKILPVKIAKVNVKKNIVLVRLLKEA